MENDIRKKHQAPKGWFGHAILIVLGVFLLCQPWFPGVGYWPILLIVIPVILVTVSHFKKRRRRKIIESKKKPVV
jgi:hypothetical protein